MSNEVASSYSTSNSNRWTYHVFLSFRGEDTRKGFTNHLHAALKRAGIIAFRDDNELQVGDVISKELLQAINDSLSAIVILSPNYASSAWCLDELQHIIESKLQVFPIFYGVKPSHVRYQLESFAKAFRKHEERFGKYEEKVQRWRDALSQVAGLSGWDSMNRLEAELIEEIVTTVWTKLQPKLPTFSEGLVGIDSKVEHLYSLLKPKLKDVHFIGIWGMGGIGKTTLANVFFNKIRSQFEISCILDNVREASSQREGLLSLQRRLLSHLKIKDTKIDDLYQGKDAIRNFLYNKKVLLVLDDVNDISQLESLAEKEWFGPGSRVIVTTRDMQLLTSHGISSELYKIEFLNQEESLQLFSQKAFKSDQPPQHYLKLSKIVVQHAGGLPLTLKLLGSFLCERSVSQWKEVLDKIKEVPDNDILMKTLGISYDGLSKRYKDLFLDIACFFKGWTKDQVTQILNDCGRYPPIGIELLIEKSLVTYDHGVLGMHDSLQEMGRNIVVEECPEIASNRSRLWSLEDIDRVLRNNKGTGSIQGIVLNLWQAYDYEACWHPESFSKMNILRLLIISSNLHLPLGLKCLSSALKVLVWKEYPLKALPLGVPLDELVRLEIPHSNIKQLWSGRQLFAKMKSIYMSHCQNLTTTPNFTATPNLEILYLDDCINLVEVHPSLGLHKKLVKVTLAGCRNLKKLPRKLEMDSLEWLDLHECSNVRKLEFGENMTHLQELDLCNIVVAELPLSLGHLTGLRTLNLESSQNLICLPNTFGNLKSLTKLNICNCPKFSKLPDNINENEALEYLNACLTSIRELPPSIAHLKNLKWLYLDRLKSQEASNSWNIILPLAHMFGFKSHNPVSMSLVLPPSISGLRMLKELSLRKCNLYDGSIPDDLGCLPSLESLDLSENNFVNLPAGCFTKLFKLAYLYLYECQSLVSAPELPPSVTHIHMYNCPSLKSLPKLPPTVQSVKASNCVSLQPLSDSQQIRSLLAAIDLEEVEDPEAQMKLSHFRPILEIPGSELPSCFENQNYSLPDKQFLEHMGIQAESAISITIDIPQFCRQSEWWGIAVSLVLLEDKYADSPLPLQYHDGLYCLTIVPRAEDKESYVLGDAEWIMWIPSYKCNHLLIFYYPFNCWHYDQNRLKLVFYATSSSATGTSNNKQVQGTSRNFVCKVNKCGARVLYKEGGASGVMQKTTKKCRNSTFHPSKESKILPEGMYVATAYAKTRIR